MRQRLLLVGAALAAAFAASVVATIPDANAQSVIIDENGVHIAPPRGYDGPPPPSAYNNGNRYGYYADDEIGPREARRIARSVGLVQTYDVHRRGPMWIVRGEDRRGRDLRVTISARDGDVVDVERRG